MKQSIMSETKINNVQPRKLKRKKKRKLESYFVTNNNNNNLCIIRDKSPTKVKIITFPKMA